MFTVAAWPDPPVALITIVGPVEPGVISNTVPQPLRPQTVEVPPSPVVP